MTLMGEKGGIIADLALPSQRQSNVPLNMSEFGAGETEKGLRNEMKNQIFHNLLYNELRVHPDEDELSILITEHIFTDRNTRAEAAGRLFEDFKVRAVMFAPQEFLSLIGSGHRTGVVVNVGHAYSSIVPIWNLNILRDKAIVSPIGGQDVTQALDLLLNLNRCNNQQIFPFYKNRKANRDRRILDPNKILTEHIKEKLAYVAEDYKDQLSKPDVLKDCELPGPEDIEVKLGRELFQCTECLFNPELFGLDHTPGLVSAINHVMDSLDEPIRTDILTQSEPVLITGSSSMLPGLTDRVKAGIREEHPGVKVVAPPEMSTLAWIGGSIWAEMEVNRNSWITVEEYRAHGPAAVHNKCF